MRFITGFSLLIIIFYIAIGILLLVLIVNIIKALRKYINSQEVRKEKDTAKKSLGEVLKKYRTENKMTQEFVAETLGVSRQAVSKWENGTSDPSTSNLIAIAKLFNISAEELLSQVKENINTEK
ncbi:MAG: helix-turn-helix transcriptional regulator [Peptoniphilus sp.]|nr:helix-turn-helix transcriptional regulator [Peptoniphilus sp.]